MNLKNITYRTCDGTEAQLEIDADKDRLVVLAFSACWTGHGQIIDNFYKELSKHYEDVVFLRVDIEESKIYVKQYDLRKIPTTLFLKDGVIIDHFEGLLPRQEIQNRIDNLIGE